MELQCKQQLELFIRHVENSSRDNTKIFNITDNCGNYATFLKVFNETHKNTHTHKVASLGFSSFIMKSVGNLLISIGNHLQENEFVVINKK